jgi:hypothetical protein
MRALILSTTSDSNNFRSCKYLAIYAFDTRIYAYRFSCKMPITFVEFKQTWNVLTKFCWNSEIIAWKFILLFSSCFMQTDWKTNTEKLLDYNLQHFVEMHRKSLYITVPVETDINISLLFKIKCKKCIYFSFIILYVLKYIVLESVQNCGQC